MAEHGGSLPKIAGLPMLESLLEGRADGNVFHCNVLCKPGFAHMNAVLPVNNWMRREAPIHVELHAWNELQQAGAYLAAQHFLCT